MKTIRLATKDDLEILSEKDTHIAYNRLKKSIEDGNVYILEADEKWIGWLRYNLFWDNTPFMNMLYILEEFQNKGYGTALVKHWETHMKELGYPEVMTSTLVHESAIHFYLKHGYQVIGGFNPNEEEYEVLLKKSF